MNYDIAVTTEIYWDTDERDDLFFDGGTMRWFGVNEETMLWLAGSCSITFRQLCGRPRVVEGDAFSVRYRTVVASDGQVISDTRTLSFDGLSHSDVVWFWKWATGQLADMIPVLERQYDNGPSITRKRSRIAFFLALLRRLIFGNG